MRITAGHGRTRIIDLHGLSHARERFARKSRSQLYADALREYLVRHAPDEVTEAMNRVMAQLDRPGSDRFGRAAAQRIFEQTEW